VTTRTQFLERVRKALGHSADLQGGPARSTPEFPSLGNVLTPVPKENLIDRFEEELKKVGGVSHHAGQPGELDQILGEILGSAEAAPVVLSRNPLLSRLQIAERLQSWGHSVAAWPRKDPVGPDELAQFRSQCFGAKAGITGADFGLVESGSFALTSVTEGSQLVSLAPPLHILLYLRSQVVETLEEVLTQLAGGPHPSVAAGRSVVFITGQSRTADIEQITIRGVHGPLSIHAILVEESCLAHL
jgi:L-lactate dehydrogenase complex protein LldG